MSFVLLEFQGGEIYKILPRGRDFVKGRAAAPLCPPPLNEALIRRKAEMPEPTGPRHSYCKLTPSSAAVLVKGLANVRQGWSATVWRTPLSCDLAGLLWVQTGPV